MRTFDKYLEIFSRPYLESITIIAVVVSIICSVLFIQFHGSSLNLFCVYGISVNGSVFSPSGDEFGRSRTQQPSYAE